MENENSDTEISRTWTLFDSTIVKVRILAAIFSAPESKIISNIISTKTIKTDMLSKALGITLFPINIEELKMKKKILSRSRKTASIPKDVYTLFEKFLKASGVRESDIVDNWITDTMMSMLKLYNNNLDDLIEVVSKIRSGVSMEEEHEFIYEIMTGKVSQRNKEKLANLSTSIKEVNS